MLAEIAATWSALSTTSKAIATALKTVEDVKAKEAIADIQNSLIDVQTKLIAAQAQYEALAEVKRQLEEKIVQHENWDSDAKRYKLKEVAKGIFVYELKSDNTNGEPVHWLCPNCFQKHEKSILSKAAVDYMERKCQRCGFEIVTEPFPGWQGGGSY